MVEIFYMAILLFIFPYLYLYVKSVDESSMVRKVKTSKLTVGDWLYKDVKVGKKLIKANWDGLLEEDIKLLRKNKKEVLVRYGIQFAPVFLISYLIYFLFFKLNFLSNFLSSFLI
jgi:prepilin signal peptidase PulO-like enzyme (type II secretory pathway)